jgi:hypothetical protein
MKRFLIIFSIVIVIAAGVGGYYLYEKSKEFVGDENNYDIVKIQVKPNLFYPVRVPKEAVIIRSNYESTYQFDIISVNKYDALPAVYDIAVEVEDTHVVADSDKNVLVATQKGFDTEVPYSLYVNWESKEYVAENPAISKLPEDAVQQANSTYTPGNITDTIIADTAVVCYTNDGFMQSVVMFSDYYNAVETYAAKFAGLYNTDFIKYCNKDGIFYAISGDFYVGVRYINENTQYAISGKGSSFFPYFINSLYKGGSPIGKGGDVTFIPKSGVIRDEADQ